MEDATVAMGEKEVQLILAQRWTVRLVVVLGGFDQVRSTRPRAGAIASRLCGATSPSAVTTEEDNLGVDAEAGLPPEDNRVAAGSCESVGRCGPGRVESAPHCGDLPEARAADTLA